MNNIDIIGASGGSASLKAAEQVKFTCATPVTWSLDPLIGKIDKDGNYTAPDTVPSEQTVSVIALDAASGKELGRYQLTLRPSNDADTATSVWQQRFSLQFSSILLWVLALSM